MRHYAFRYLREWKQPDNRPKYPSQSQFAQVDPGDDEADIVDKQPDSDFAENPEILDGNTADRHEICWEVRMRDVSRRWVYAVVSSFLFLLLFLLPYFLPFLKKTNVVRWGWKIDRTRFCLHVFLRVDIDLFKKIMRCGEGMKNRLYKILLACFFTHRYIDRISTMPPKQSKHAIMMIMVNALRARFALRERIAICTYRAWNAQKTHTHTYIHTHIDFTLWLRLRDKLERFIYTCCIDRDHISVDRLVG